MTRRLVCAVLGCFVLVLTASLGNTQPQAPSSSAGGKPGAMDDLSLAELKKRALTYWEARVKKDYRTEYDLLEPRARARFSPDEYGRGRMVQYLAAQVEGAERNGNFGSVAVRLLVRIVAPPPIRVPPRNEATEFQDHWVLIDGTWYRSLEAETGDRPPWPEIPR